MKNSKNSRFRNVKILCVGDVILDSYVHGDVERISPEAPIPILKIIKESFVLGGAGNVARNICSGGGSCYLISVVGDDINYKILKRLSKNEKRLTANFFIEKGLMTTKKQRYISGQQQILRVDLEENIKLKSSLKKKILDCFKTQLKDSDLVILSDYNKGLLSQDLVEEMIKISKELKKIIIVDPKKESFDQYKGATILTPNLKELLVASKRAKMENFEQKDRIEEISKRFIKTLNLKCLIATKSSEGMSISQINKPTVNLPSKALEVFDVSGAGDTVVSYLGLCLASKMNVVDSAKVANEAAGIAVSKFGTASVHYNEVSNDFKTTNKQCTLNEAKLKIDQIKNLKRIGFTNGCFDIIHSGHIKYLSKSRRNCDYLVLGLNSDSSVKKLKGNDRPIINERERVFILSEFSFVDLIIVFNDLTPIKLIRSLKPDILFKGKDYELKNVVGHQEILKWGGKVKLIDLDVGKSTTSIIERIKNES
tara:strand:+ start:42 stop:1487 length:1446 start_codon:yes stop_codon:yes gene_type:complete